MKEAIAYRNALMHPAKTTESLGRTVAACEALVRFCMQHREAAPKSPRNPVATPPAHLTEHFLPRLKNKHKRAGFDILRKIVDTIDTIGINAYWQAGGTGSWYDGLYKDNIWDIGITLNAPLTLIYSVYKANSSYEAAKDRPEDHSDSYYSKVLKDWLAVYAELEAISNIDTRKILQIEVSEPLPDVPRPTKADLPQNQPTFCSQPLSFTCPWCKDLTDTPFLPVASQTNLAVECRQCRRRCRVKYEVVYTSDGKALPRTLQAECFSTSHTSPPPEEVVRPKPPADPAPLPPPPIPSEFEFCTAPLRYHCSWCGNLTTSRLLLPALRSEVLDQCQHCSERSHVEYEVDVSNGKAVPTPSRATRHVPPSSPPPPPQPQSQPPERPPYDEVPPGRPKVIDDEGLKKRALAIVFSLLVASVLIGGTVLTLRNGDSSGEHRTATPEPQHDSPPQLLDARPLLDAPSSMSLLPDAPPPLDASFASADRKWYLQKGSTVVVRPGQNASKILRARMRKKCDQSLADLFQGRSEADGTELACSNGHLPKRIDVNTVLKARRTFLCPLHGEERDMTKIKEEFCRDLEEPRGRKGTKTTNSPPGGDVAPNE